VERDGSCHVELAAYPESHPFAQSKGTDNVVAFTTDRYQKQPLVIQGPGAGPEVTAGGVFADLLRLSSYLGARL
jgi:aspartokinase/homoserine dehydrogenase 1